MCEAASNGRSSSGLGRERAPPGEWERKEGVLLIKFNQKFERNQRLTPPPTLHPAAKLVLAWKGPGGSQSPRCPIVLDSVRAVGSSGGKLREFEVGKSLCVTPIPEFISFSYGERTKG